MRVPGFEVQVDTERVPWRETSVAGVQWYLLASEEAPEETLGEPSEEPPEGELPSSRGSGARPGGTVLIRMAPGCGYPPHRHLGIEEVLVLQGGYRDELGTHVAGDYVRYPSGSRHAPVAIGDSEGSCGPSNPACVLFTTARGGIELL